MFERIFDPQHGRVPVARSRILVFIVLATVVFTISTRELWHASAAAIPAPLVPCSSPASDDTPEWGIFSDEIDAVDFFERKPVPVNCDAAQLADVAAADTDEGTGDVPINSHGLTEPMAMH